MPQQTFKSITDRKMIDKFLTEHKWAIQADWTFVSISNNLFLISVYKYAGTHARKHAPTHALSINSHVRTVTSILSVKQCGNKLRK